MKFNKILHPEVVLGLRGDLKLTQCYAELFQKIGKHPEGGYTYDDDLFDAFVKDVPFMDSILMPWKFAHDWHKGERPHVFHAGKDFVKAMTKMDREIPVDFLPERFFAYFSFPEKTIHDGDHWIQGCYIFIGPPQETGIRKSEWGHDKVLWMVYYTEDFQQCARFQCPLTKEKLSELINKAPVLPSIFNIEEKKDENVVTMLSAVASNNIEVYLVTLNLALYVNSINCDLMPLPPAYKLQPSKKKEAVSAGVLNQCKIPITFVSWNYQHPRQRHVDSSWVDTFQRWQPCGPGNKQVKLIWVKPDGGFERKYKKNSENK